MGFLDGMVQAGLSKLLGEGSGIKAKLAQVAIQEILSKGSGQGGGITQFLATLEDNGLAETVQSWVASGDNMSVSAEQLQGAMDNNLLSGLAQKVGVSEGDVATNLSEMLPGIIDKLTSTGEIKENLDISDAMGLVSKFLK